MKNNDYIAKDLSAELAHATSIVPPNAADESTYAKARSAALDAGAAAEAFARGDSDAGLQAIERVIRGFREVARDFGLELAEVLPTEPCKVCGILTADFHSVPSTTNPTHYLCATCVREAPPTDTKGAPAEADTTSYGPGEAHLAVSHLIHVRADHWYVGVKVLVGEKTPAGGTSMHHNVATELLISPARAIDFAWQILQAGSSAMAGRELRIGPAGVAVRPDGIMVVYAGGVPIFAVRPEGIERFAADVANAAASMRAPSNNVRPMVLQ